MHDVAYTVCTLACDWNKDGDVTPNNGGTVHYEEALIIRK